LTGEAWISDSTWHAFELNLETGNVVDGPFGRVSRTSTPANQIAADLVSRVNNARAATSESASAALGELARRTFVIRISSPGALPWLKIAPRTRWRWTGVREYPQYGGIAGNVLLAFTVDGGNDHPGR
jgi:hypothetical protein